MESANDQKLRADLVGFVKEIIRGTVGSSKSRIIIFCVILFLQFSAVPFFTFLWSWDYPDTYSGLKQKETVRAVFWVNFGLVKYLLLLTLIVMSPQERTGKRRFAKYGILFFGLYLWAVLDLLSVAIEADERKSEMVEKSFQEYKVPVYGKVVFSSYKRDKLSGRIPVSVAEKLSAATNGYLIVVQIDSTDYPYPGLKSHLSYFNGYCESRGMLTNIPPRVPDLPGCIQFNVDFPCGLRQLPAIPALNKYVKIQYDPEENGIQLFVDSSTAATPVSDSLSLKLQEIN